MDSITITDLELWTHIGVPDAERKLEQRLLVTISMDLEQSAGKSDNIKDSLDYESVANTVSDLARTERKTIEKLAEDIAQTILQDFKPDLVTVTIKKFILPNTKDVSVTITRP